MGHYADCSNYYISPKACKHHPHNLIRYKKSKKCIECVKRDNKITNTKYNPLRSKKHESLHMETA